MMATRRSQSWGWWVFAAGPLGVPHKLAILEILLSATACMNPCTAAAADFAGCTDDVLFPPQASSRTAVAQHPSLVTSDSLIEG
jgi:hypothetical protein